MVLFQITRFDLKQMNLLLLKYSCSVSTIVFNQIISEKVKLLFLVSKTYQLLVYPLIIELWVYISFGY